MKKKLFFMLFLCLSLLWATKIEFGNQTIFYGIAEPSFSGYWVINNRGTNTFSGNHIATFDSDEQLWILHHPVTIIIDEGDSLLSFIYSYRYYRQEDSQKEWIYLNPICEGVHQHASGYWYVSFFFEEEIPLFSLPLDTGEYELEIYINATVLGIAGDTLCKCYICPDDQDMIANFTVEMDTESSTSLALDFFTARELDQCINLSWQTCSESENLSFILERNGDCIARIPGAGTSNIKQYYEYNDADITIGDYIYKLYDVDYAGKIYLLDSLRVNIGNAFKPKLNVKPNPFNVLTVLSVEIENATNCELKIYDIQGKLIDELYKGYLNKGHYGFKWNASVFPSGIYVVRMITDMASVDQKIVLMK